MGFLFTQQLKKTVEELNEALATKEEIAQRCRELDLQVGLILSLGPPALRRTPFTTRSVSNLVVTKVL